MTDHRPHMLPKVRSDQIMASAAGSPCTVRIADFIPGRRCTGPETVVGAHLPVGWGKGTGTKETDLAAAYACFACHDIIDGRDIEARNYLMQRHGAAVLMRYLAGLTETHALMLGQGIIVVPDGKIV